MIFILNYWKLNSRLTFKGFHSFFLILHFIFVTSRIPQLLISWQFLANVLSFLILHLFYRIQTLSASFTLSNYSHKEVLFIFYYISILVQLLVFVFQLSSLKSLFHIFMFSFSMQRFIHGEGVYLQLIHLTTFLTFVFALYKLHSLLYVKQLLFLISQAHFFIALKVHTQ